MSNSNPSSNGSSNTSTMLKKIEVCHFGNLLHRVHLRFSNVCNFVLLVNENIKRG